MHPGPKKLSKLDFGLHRIQLSFVTLMAARGAEFGPLVGRVLGDNQFSQQISPYLKLLQTLHNKCLNFKNVYV